MAMSFSDRARSRAEDAPPEEKQAGTETSARQSEQILEESDERQDDRDAAPAALVEHRRSEETVVPLDNPAP